MDSWNIELKKNINELTEKYVEDTNCKMDRMGIDGITGAKWLHVVKEQIITDYTAALDNAKLLQEKLIEKSKREFLEIKCKILQIIQELGVKPSLHIGKTLCSSDESLFLVTDENMQQLGKYYDTLKQQKSNTANEIFQLREKAGSLWEKLEEDMRSTSEFLQRHTGNSLATLEAFKQEVKRLETLRIADIEKFIKMMREDLIKLWEKCHFASSERDKLECLHDNLYTEDLLMLHQIEIEKTRKYYNENKEVLLKLEMEDKYWQRKQELDERATDPNRYKNRGGTLLKEEKERNGLAKKLRDIEVELLDFAVKYEREHNKPFLTWGRSIPDKIARTKENYENNKKQQLSTKKQQRELSPGGLGLTPDLRLQPTQISSDKKKTPAEEIPKLKINDMTIAPNKDSPTHKKRIRYSLERKKRIGKIRRLSKLLEKNTKSKGDPLGYNTSEKNIIEESPCRSTLFDEAHSSALATALPATPEGPRTPSKYTT